MRVVSGTAENLPYEDDTFDVVISGSDVQHFISIIWIFMTSMKR